MAHGFDSYRIFISAPGDMEADRQACSAAIAQVNEALAMPAKILMVSFGVRDNDHIVSSRGIVSDNVRWSSYFIQLFQDDWGPRDLFRKLFYLARECRLDPAMPMRDVIVCLKDAPHETNPEILAFRKELDELQDVQVLRYSALNELTSLLAEACGAWTQSLIDEGLRSSDVTPQSSST